MNTEYLPATALAQQELVLLHGWGSNRNVWRPLLASLRPWANITLLDIPGCAPGCALARSLGGDSESQLSSVCEAVLAACPPRAVYLGWSLGGQLAIALAARNPHRVSAVLTLCTNPRFVADGAWPGMAADMFVQFRLETLQHPEAARRRFDSLQVDGAARPRALRRELLVLREGYVAGLPDVGLAWLQDLDQRNVLQSLKQPQLHMLADSDALVPAALAASLELLLGDNAAAAVQVIEKSCHVAPLDAPIEVAARAKRFLADAGVLNGEAQKDELLAKADVAESFSRAAPRYDSVAQLQRDVGSELLERLDTTARSPETVLDLGSGTGHFYPALRARYPNAQYIGLDLAEGMIRYSRDRFPDAGQWLVGDAEALPLTANSVDLIFSSLAVQWCYRPQVLFAELARVLRPGGRCVFSSLGPGTLRELRAAWAAVDQHQHVNEFLSPEVLSVAATAIPCLKFGLNSRHYRMEYRQVGELLNELKTLGAHNVNRNRRTGLTGRRALQGMLKAYEEWREDDVLPATYDVMFGVLEKV